MASAVHGIHVRAVSIYFWHFKIGIEFYELSGHIIILNIYSACDQSKSEKKKSGRALQPQDEKWACASEFSSNPGKTDDYYGFRINDRCCDAKGGKYWQVIQAILIKIGSCCSYLV